MLRTLGARFVRPAAQTAWKLVTPPTTRTGFKTAALAQDAGNRLGRPRGLQITLPVGRSLHRHPFKLATDLFPEQVGSVFRDIEDEISRLWGDQHPSRGERHGPAGRAFGAVDIHESKDAFSFTVDAPGLTKADITVHVTPDNVLMIAGERSAEEKKDDHGFHRFERSYGKFQRRFSLPENVDTTGISAELKNGVLQVDVPKKESEKRELTEISVKDSASAAEEPEATNV